MNLNMTDGLWCRMSWHAQQRWLRDATKLRRQLQADIDARLATERARNAHDAGRAYDAAARLADLLNDGQGEARLWAATREAEEAMTAAREAS